MNNDFFIAILSGWIILLLFWTTIIAFVYLRKPPNSKLGKKVINRSYLFFLVIFFLILSFRYSDSFF